jgi:transcriptional regulator with XRE-family HTH domain
MSKTLKQLREESGLTLQQVVDRMQERDSRLPRTHVGLIHIEQRGTDRLLTLRALADIYNVPLSTVEEAAKNSAKFCTV